ncbi:hypothetical protein [Microcystis phage Mwe-JY26]
MPKIYSVYDGGADTFHFRSRKRAESMAKDLSEVNGSTAEVTLCTFAKLDMNLFIRVLDSDGGGWADTQEVVARFTNGKKEAIR